MNHRLNTFVDRIDGARTADDTWREMLRLFRDLGFDVVTYGFARTLGPDAPPVVTVWSNWPDWYVWRYEEEGYALHDPSVHHCMTSLAPTYQGASQLGQHADGVVRRLIDEAADCGVRSGIIYPTRWAAGGVGGFSVSNGMECDEFRRFMAGREALVKLAGVYAHTRLQMQLLAGWAAEVHLTPRERECLLWSATGMNSKQVARRLGVSPQAVDFHILNACRKLGAATRAHAVARALALGLITL